MSEDCVRARRGLLVYFALLVAGSAFFETLLVRSHQPIGKSPGLVYGLMWTPALASVVARLVLREGVRDVSFRLHAPGLRALGLAWLWPLVVGGAAYGTAWAAGLAPFAPPMMSELGVAGGPARRFVVLLLASATIVTLLSALSAFGEELGWRGYMLTRLVRAGVPHPVLVSGLVWALWHTPLILSGLYAAGPSPALAAGLFVVNVTAIGFLMAWLRLRSGSLWPALMLHAAWNAVIQGAFDASTKGSSPWVGESGILVTAVNVALTAVLVRGAWPARNAPGDEPFATVPGLRG